MIDEAPKLAVACRCLPVFLPLFTVVFWPFCVWVASQPRELEPILEIPPGLLQAACKGIHAKVRRGHDRRVAQTRRRMPVLASFVALLPQKNTLARMPVHAAGENPSGISRIGSTSRGCERELFCG